MDNKIALMLYSAQDILTDVAARARQARLAENLSQEGLAMRSGVSLGSIKRFERTGKISLENLVELAMALRLEKGFDELFQITKHKTLANVIAKQDRKVRKRGMKK